MIRHWKRARVNNSGTQGVANPTLHSTTSTRVGREAVIEICCTEIKATTRCIWCISALIASSKKACGTCEACSDIESNQYGTPARRTAKVLRDLSYNTSRVAKEWRVSERHDYTSGGHSPMAEKMTTHSYSGRCRYVAAHPTNPDSRCGRFPSRPSRDGLQGWCRLSCLGLRCGGSFLCYTGVCTFIQGTTLKPKRSSQC